MRTAAFFFTASLSILASSAQTPEWIWHPETNASTVYFRKAFRIPPQTWNSRLTISADDRAEVFLNGVLIARCTDWRQPSRSEVTVRLNQGENVLAVKAENKSAAGDARGVLVHLNVGGELNFVSDASWLSSTNDEPNWSALTFNAAHWSKVATLASHGAEPWGDVLFRPAATHPDSIKVPNGFKVELLRSAEPAEGSWICMTFDDQGRIIISPQGDTRPLLRMTLGDDSAAQARARLSERAAPRITNESLKITKLETIEAPIGYAMGLLHAFDSLYVNGIGPEGSGLHRLIDANKNDRYETNELHLLKRFRGGSEHGYHALALGPDKKIYVLNGNGTQLPPGISPKSPYRNYAEDALTGERGDDRPGTKAPNCHVLRTDAEGKEWELFAGGMRNAYDMDFNDDGELFTFDSDNEWDWGVPWYRPTRVIHLVSGAEAGWRDGTRMWHEDYSGAMPTTAYVGIGSPTGAKFVRGENFPAQYRRALFIQDWSYGRIMAVHLTEAGATYTGTVEPFLEGAPLNVTSLSFGPDGAMYFITGGRSTQSGLYRVTYSGSKMANVGSREEKRQTAAPLQNAGASPKALESGEAFGLRQSSAAFPPTTEGLPAPRAARETRRKLEALHAGATIADWPFIQNFLAGNDPAIRFAARVALEAMPVTAWKRVAPQRGLSPLFALARVGSAQDQAAVFSALRRYPMRALSDARRLAKVRTIQVSLARHGTSHSEEWKPLINELNDYFPSASPELQREILRVLLHVNALGAVSKTIQAMGEADSREDQLFYVELLRNVKEGWTLADREKFFSWFLPSTEPKPKGQHLEKYFADVKRRYVDGASYDNYLRDFRRQAIATLTSEEKKQLEPLLAQPIAPAQLTPANPRQFVRDWKMEDLLPELGKPRKPDLARGRQAFVDAQCLSCHRFGNDGGASGPELTAAASKYADPDLLESILDPSKVINEQYQDHTVFVSDGEILTGRLVTDSDTEVVLETDRLSGAKEKLPKTKVETMRPSTVSPMPEGLANVLTREEILDLLAYMRAGSGTTR